MKLLKISLSWVRISVICIVVIVAVIMVSRQPGIEKLVKRIMTSALVSNEKEWILRVDQTFTLCGHTESATRRYPTSDLMQEAIQSSGGSQLKKMKGRFLVQVILKDDYCTSCRNNHFIGVSGEKIVIIRGTPLRPGPIQERTAIKITELPKLELEDLQKGIPFSNEQEKLQLIEGLKGLATN